MAGADQLEGGTGDDTFYVDNLDDVLVELAGEGFDSVFIDAIVLSNQTYVLAAGAHVEWLSTSNTAGTWNVSIMGNEIAQYLIGNYGGNNLNGLGGADVMVGYGGWDVYTVDDPGDIVVEVAGEGHDVVNSSISYALAAGVSVEVLQAASAGLTVAINLTGNELYNHIVGNMGKNILDGGAGPDTMSGLNGDDTYIVNDAGDIISQETGGFDSLFTSTSYSLDDTAFVEWLSTSWTAGTDAIDIIVRTVSGPQTQLNQYLIGNQGANVLDGGRGADVMVGYAGNDTYGIDNAGDITVETAGAGFDALYTSVSYVLTAGSDVEWLSTSLTVGTGALDLTGNEIVNYLIGNNGANILNGRGGSDVINGYGGADTFAFTTALGAGNVDTVVDMVAGTDKIALDDAIFTAVGAPGTLNANAFVIGAAAADADDRIVYNSATGQLFYDADGNGGGAQVQFATLSTGLALTATDFTVI